MGKLQKWIEHDSFTFLALVVTPEISTMMKSVFAFLALLVSANAFMPVNQAAGRLSLYDDASPAVLLEIRWTWVDDFLMAHQTPQKPPFGIHVSDLIRYFTIVVVTMKGMFFSRQL